MSSRALRKLKGKDDSLQNGNGGGDVSEGEDEETSESVSIEEPAVNKFDLLCDEDNSKESADSDIDQISKKESESKVSAVLANLAEPNTDQVEESSTKQKKKRKKKKKKGKEPIKILDEEDEIDASIREVNEILGELPQVNSNAVFDSDSNVTMAMKALLAVEHKNLNPDNEMRKIFGSRVVQTEQSRRRNNQRRTAIRNTWLARPKDTWPVMGKAGLSMELLEAKHGVQYFTFQHSKAYQQIEFHFMDAVESLNPQNIMDILKVHPHHVNCLLQLSEISRINEDMPVAAELIERALYVFEITFHSMFSLTQGNCRLDYRRPENRSFYFALFHHLGFVGKRGCYRTALELCKLILSLDPEGDPLCMLLMIDFYALRSEQFEFLIRMNDEWGAHRNLSQLPNFAFSVALAKFHLAKKQNSTTSSSDAKLQDALLMFPGILVPLLDKCGIQPDSRVMKHSFFNDSSNMPPSLEQLVMLYIGRSHVCWKDPDVVHWLQSNVNEVLSRVTENDPVIKEYAEKRKVRYQGTPRNISRHILISEIKEARAALPPDVTNSPILNYDPLPPTDNIESYKRPERTLRGQEESGMLSLFFRSLLPNFNAQDVVDDVDLGGAAAAGQGHNLRHGVGDLMNAMRELLNNIQPVPPPRENNGNENDDNDNGEEQNEWD